MKRFIVIFAAAALALGVVNPASANFIYDLTGISGHQQFETASVLTSSTLITSFTINTSPTYTVLALGPGEIPVVIEVQVAKYAVAFRQPRIDLERACHLRKREGARLGL